MLSCGHSSLTLYIQLYLSGLRPDARRPGAAAAPGAASPRATRSTGTRRAWRPPPARSARASATRSAWPWPPAASAACSTRTPRPATSPFDHHIYAFGSDGDIEEGISHEASALAGHQQLGNLIVIYDDNNISIEDDTNIAKSEDVAARYEAYGWHVQRVNWRQPGGYDEDVEALYAALLAARAETGRPSLISLRTIIGWPAPNKQNTGEAHGSALGADEVAATKKILGFDPDVNFPAEDEVVAHARQVGERGARGARRVGRAVRRVGGSDHPEQRGAARPAVRPRPARRLDRRAAGVRAQRQGHRHPQGVRRGAGRAGAGAARAVGRLGRPGRQQRHHDEGRAVLHPRPSTRPRCSPATRTAARCTSASASTPWARSCNGIALHGLTRPYGGTFLVFSDYMRGAVRLAALMKLPVTYVWTHDSIGLGEDGPTHQPVEHLWALRAIPGLDVVRPADANETAVGLADHPGAHRPPGRRCA